MSDVLLLMIVGPVGFLLAIVASSVRFSRRGVPAGEIPNKVAARAPHILVGVLAMLAVSMMILVPEAVGAAWSSFAGADTWTDAAIGAAVGTALGLAYVSRIAGWLEVAQRRFGDYVPPGSVPGTVSSHAGAFFVANLLLAPIVEETIYRGVAIPLLTPDHGAVMAVVASCALFGLLHWTGGVWYVVLTGTLVGGTCAGLFLSCGDLVAPLAAHTALNAVEYVWAVRPRRSRRPT